MLKLYPAHLINGVTVYEDDDPHSPAFYVMPDQPDFRRDATGAPIMKFIEYVTPVILPDGSDGGGFLIFDSQFALSQATINSVTAGCATILANRLIPAPGVDPATAQQQQLTALQASTDAANANNPTPGAPPPPPASAGTIGLTDGKGNAIPPQISMPNFSSGTASLVLLDSGGNLVTKIQSAGKPSLLGSMICSFTASLSTTGAAVVKQAMSGGGGIVQIAYNLSYWGSLPDITGHVWFDSMKFASFYQTIDKTGGHWWSGPDTENEKMRDAFTAAQSGGVEFDFTGDQSTDPDAQKLKTDLVNWGWQQLAAAAAASQGQSTAAPSSSSGSGDGSSDGSSGSGSGSGTTGVAGGVTGGNTGAELGSDTGTDGMDHVKRDEQSSSTYSFDETYKEADSILFNTTQQGTLPNPTPAQMAACSVTINANDPFFAQVNATVQVDADFTKFLIDSVDVTCTYHALPPTPNTVAGLQFTKPDDILKFNSITNNGDKHYNINFNVNYQDQNQPYVSPTITTQAPVYSIDVGSLGILYANMTVSNVDFTTVSSVQVAITYPDTDPSGAAVKREFSLNATQRTATLVVIMLKPINKKYSYQITYVMMDGTQVVRPWQQDNTTELFINSPFSPTTVSWIAEGDFVNDINNIFLRMTYTDSLNNYTQSTDFVFNAAKPNTDWKFPVITGSPGVLTYSGVVTHKNNTQENIPQTTATGNLVTFGPPNQSVITVTPDVSLIDFTQVKLIQVEFTYADPANNISLSSEIVIKSTGATPPSWTFYVRDPTKKAYTYTATYFVTAPGAPPKQVVAPAATATDTDLVLMMPSS